MNPSNHPGATLNAPRRVRRWTWLALLTAIGVIVALLATRKETPHARVEKEAKRILSSVRKSDRNSSLLYRTLETMQNWPDPFPTLAEKLMGDNTDEPDPAESLASLGPWAVPILTNALTSDRSAAVRATAAEALSRMQDMNLLPALLAAFKSEREAPVQSAILQALGESRDERAEPLLASVLFSTNDSQVRISAASALGQFESSYAISNLTQTLASDADSSVRQALLLWDLPWTTKTEAKPALLAALQSDRDSDVRSYAARALRTHPDDDTVHALITASKQDSDAPNVRVAAISVLGEMTNVAVYPALLDAIRQESAEVRAAAIAALGNFPGAETEAIFAETLTSDSADKVRTSAAEAMERLPGIRTNRTLLTALTRSLQTDTAQEVRAAAASSLAQVGGVEAMLTLRNLLETERSGRVQIEAIGGVYRHASSNVTDVLLRLLEQSNLDVDALRETVRCLGLARAQLATPKLAQLLKDSKEELVRQAAATALGALDNTNAAAALQEALHRDDSAYVRSAIATSLGEMTVTRTTAVASNLLVALKREVDASVRVNLTSALGSLGDPVALPLLIQTLRSEKDRQLRAEAATALGKLKQTDAVPPLMKAIQRDPDRTVRANGLQSLYCLAGQEQEPFFLEIFKNDLSVRAEVANILGITASPEACSALMDSLQNGGWPARAAVIQALGDTGDRRATTPLIELLNGEASVASRSAAATALGRLCDPAAIPALQKTLEDRIVSIRQEAAWALGHIGNTSAAPALSRALSHDNFEVQFAASFALAETGARGEASALVPLLNHADERIRLAAASSLAFLDRADGISVLEVNLRSTDVWRRFTALISLLRLDTAETRQLLGDRPDTDPTLAAAIEAGLRLGGPGAATNLLCSAPDNESMMEDFRQFGARALILFNDPSTLPALKANANDLRAEIRSAARIAIRRIENRSAAKLPGHPRP
jgi:HEAT repeat protein